MRGRGGGRAVPDRVLRCRDGSFFDKIAAQLRGALLIAGKLASDLCALEGANLYTGDTAVSDKGRSLVWQSLAS